MGKGEAVDAHANWRGMLVVGTCFVVGALLLRIAVMPPLHKWVLLVLLMLPTCALVLLEILRFFSSKSCASCGFRSDVKLSDLDQCPHCGGLFGEAADLIPHDEVLRLSKYLADSRPTVKLIGMVVAMAIRDGADEIRFVGHDEHDESQAPWEASHRLWRIWLNLNGESYEAVPPPRHLGTSVFLLLREIHHRTGGDAADSPACFRIAIDSLSLSAELAIEEADEEQVARIHLVGKDPAAYGVVQPKLERLFRSARTSDKLDAAQEFTG